MTYIQARSRALDLFGKTAKVEESKPMVYSTTGEPRPTHRVGRMLRGTFFLVEGAGFSFEEAFAEVERRAASTRAAFERARDGVA